MRPSDTWSARRSAWPSRLATVSAWAFVGCWAVWAVLRLVGAERVPGLSVPLVPALAFFPYVAATVVIPVIYTMSLRRWKAAAAAAAVAIVSLGLLAPRGIADVVPPGSGPAARGPVLRILTVNLLFGEARPEVVVRLARRSGADVVSLQEMTPEAVTRLESAGLARLLPYKVLRSDMGPLGSGLYSRYRLRDLGDVGGPGGSGFAMPRAAMELPSRSGGGTVEVVAVHQQPPMGPRRVLEWSHDFGYLGGLPPAAPPRRVRILAGDFNATLDHLRMRQLLDRGGYRDAAAAAGEGLTPTFDDPRGYPPITLDHVLVDRRVDVRRVAVHDMPGSDHDAVVAELRLP